MLKLEGIRFEVSEGGRKKKILDDVSLKIRAGSFVVITGPNGSGKSTLASIIMGVKKPTAGKIIFDGKDITELSITERAKAGIAFSFQQPVKFKGLTVFDILETASGWDLSEKEAGGYLKKVGLAQDYLAREIDSGLSGGELKRIEIASVLARKAKLTVFDEPEAGIDLWSFEKLTGVFKKMKAEKQTVVIISHQERILKIADEIVILEAGKIKKRGTAAKILPEIVGGKDEF